MLYRVLLMKFTSSPRCSVIIRAAGVAAALALLGSCGGGSSEEKSPATTTTSVAPRAKNAALNWSVQTPSGVVRPGQVTPDGASIRPVRS